jgi:ABC-2 type transport system ATP-binding protein
MSVKVNELTKIYGTQKAVDSVSFEAKKGEVLGFLGPNGAGKTTTMKVITCFIPQTSGEATVCGFDVEKESMEVRKRIGYLPEHNPLYKEMYVKEYLRFIGGIHQIKNLGSRIDEMIEMTGLEREQHKLIGTLSKGYRQRVGLAQAMIHDPEVLILDEPTSGLDPN